MFTKTLVFTDIEGSTALVERLGDDGAAALWAEHDRLARKLMAEHGGREIDRSDGFFVLFDGVADAARFALGYHGVTALLGLAARVGLHHAAVTLRENPPDAVARGAKPLEVEGVAKPTAARIMALARGGQTLLSEAACLAIGQPPAGTEVHAHGHYRLKGIDEPQAVFELGAAQATFTPPADGEKAYRVVRTNDLWLPLRNVRHNLAPERDAFVGRGAELRRLARRMDSGARLISVIGVGGTGKTRFVRRYGLAWLGEWPGGVYFCDLSEARTLEGICFAVASALEVPLGKDDPVVQLGHAIAGRGRCLVILDNFEQVAEHARATLGHWLDRAGQAAFIVTTRELLHLPGEGAFAVEPLAVTSEAIELFAVRASAQRATFALDATTRPVVAELVKLLDGLPLAIELAAARVRVLSPAQIVQRVNDRFALLAGARAAASRQVTLKATIDWSWELLTPWEQAALAQCSVFEGGFTLQAAEAVLDRSSWTEAAAVLDTIQALVDKSLLRAWLPKAGANQDVAELYFGMYLSIHEYAAQKLQRMSPEGETQAQLRHGRYCARFGTDEAIDGLQTHGGARRLQALALEIGNLMLACRNAVSRSDAATAVRTFVAASQVLQKQGPLSAAVALGDQVLAMPGLDLREKAVAGVTHAASLRISGRLDEARSVLLPAVHAARDSGDGRSEQAAHLLLGVVSYLQGDLAEGSTRTQNALSICRQIGHRSQEAVVLNTMGLMSFLAGQLQVAEARFLAAVQIHREVGNLDAEGNSLCNLGELLRQQGQIHRARTLLEQGIELHRRCGNRRLEAYALEYLALLTAIEGRPDTARGLFSQALSIAREVGDRGKEGELLSNLAEVQRREGDLGAALSLGLAALEIHRELSNRRFEAIATVELGEIARLQHRMPEARQLFDKALAMQIACGDRRNEGITSGLLAAWFLDEGQLDEADEKIEAGENILREVNEVIELARLACLKGFIAMARGDREGASRAVTRADQMTSGLGPGAAAIVGRDLARLRTALAP